MSAYTVVFTVDDRYLETLETLNKACVGRLVMIMMQPSYLFHFFVFLDSLEAGKCVPNTPVPHFTYI